MRARSCLAAAASVGALCVLTACQVGSTAPTASSSSAPVSTATSSAAPSTVGPPAPPTTKATPVVDASAPTTPARPVEAAVQQGGRYWGVYLASSPTPGSRPVQSAYARLHEQGYTGSVGQAGCDIGALDSIGIAQGDEVASVYFATPDEAKRFLARWNRPYVGYVQVRTYCAD